MDVSFNSSLIAFIENNKIHVHDITRSKQLTTFESSRSPFSKIEISADLHLYASERDGFFSLYNLKSCKQEANFRLQNGPITTFEVASETLYMVTSSNTLFITDLQGNTLKSINLEKCGDSQIGPITCLAVYDGTVCFGSGNSIYLINQSSKVKRIVTLAKKIELLQFTEQGKFLVSATKDRLVNLWYLKKIKENEPLITLKCSAIPRKLVTKQISSDVYHLFALSSDKIEVFNVAFAEIDVNKPNSPSLVVEAKAILDFQIEIGNSKGTLKIARGSMFSFGVESFQYSEGGKFGERKVVLKNAIVKDESKKSSLQKGKDKLLAEDHRLAVNFGKNPQFKTSVNANIDPKLGLSSVLKTAVINQDWNNLEWVLQNTDQSVIRNTIEALGTVDLERFVGALGIMVQLNKLNQFLVANWLEKTIKLKFGEVANMNEQTKETFASLKSYVQLRTACLGELIGLKGKLESLVDVPEDKDDMNENANLVYYESDSEEEKRKDIADKLKERNVRKEKLLGNKREERKVEESEDSFVEEDEDEVENDQLYDDEISE